MDSTHLRALLTAAAADEPARDGHAWLRRRRRRRFALELDRRGVFLRFGQTEAYLCAEAGADWAFERGLDGLDLQAWRLHLIIEPVPTG